MSKLSQVVFIALALFVVSSSADARCSMSYVCDDYGTNCQYQDVCDSTLDLPSVDINPLPALPSMELEPLPSLDLPPLGTSSCEYKQVNGQWMNVCW